jgi:integrase/recombinase XerD
MYVRDPSRVVVTGPLAAHAGGFRAELGQRGYARASAAELMQLMAHLSRWLGSEHLEPAGLTAEVAGRFLADRRERYRRLLTEKALRGHLIHTDACLSQRQDFPAFKVPHFRCMTCYRSPS